jgi:hypothetical protein
MIFVMSSGPGFALLRTDLLSVHPWLGALGERDPKRVGMKRFPFDIVFSLVLPHVILLPNSASGPHFGRLYSTKRKAVWRRRKALRSSAAGNIPAEATITPGNNLGEAMRGVFLGLEHERHRRRDRPPPQAAGVLARESVVPRHLRSMLLTKQP